MYRTMWCDFCSAELGLSDVRSEWKINEQFDLIRLAIGKPAVSNFGCKSRVAVNDSSDLVQYIYISIVR